VTALGRPPHRAREGHGQHLQIRSLVSDPDDRRADYLGLDAALRAVEPLPAGTLAMLAPRPAAGPTLAFLQLLLGPANAAFSGRMLLGILDPTDELVTGRGRDVFPGAECRRVGEQCVTQVGGQRVYDPPGTCWLLTGRW